VRLRFRFLLAAVVLFAVSLVLPAITYDVSGTSDSMSGLSLLLMGWFNVFAGVAGWLANPFFAFGCVAVLLRRKITSIVLLVLSLLLAISSVQLFSSGVMKDESGVLYPLQYFSAGFYVWLAAIVVALISAFIKDTLVTT
jgi:hypothetical protein